MHKWKENEFGKHFWKIIPKSLQIGPKIGPKLVVRVQKGQNYGPLWFQKWRVLACAGVCLDLGTIKIRKLCTNGRKMNLESILGK